MSNKSWTTDQQNAIDARSGSVLVSAAAGSGKTAVLVQRIISRLSDIQNPCDADRLLVVTFTRAAAAEMRERIAKSMDALIRAQPQNNALMRQRLLLDSASISTIHSFCSDLIRQNCHRLDVSPSFRIADEAEIAIMRSDAVNEALETLYANNEKKEVFLKLAEQISSYKDDKKLAETILSIYDFTSSCPFPDVWFEQKLNMYSESTDISDSVWYKILAERTLRAAEHCLSLCNSATELMNGESRIMAAYMPAFEDDIEFLNQIKQNTEQKNFNGVYELLLNKKGFKALGALRKYEDVQTQSTVKELRNGVKKTVTKIQKIWCADTDDTALDINKLYPLIDVLFYSVRLFNSIFDRIKKEKNVLDFTDLEHLTVSLLVEPTADGTLIRTPFARELSQKYVEILVDEYQDTNETQDLIFRAVSREESNLFTVGDVKQSIYSFRQAKPEIFLNRYNSLPDYTGGNYPARITLGKNFRSRAEVTKTVNHIFKNIMQGTGGLYYNDGHALEAAANYPPDSKAYTELHIIEREEQDSDTAEGYYIAKLIRNMIDDGYTVTEKDGTQRPAGYGDFCILRRSVRAGGRTMAEAMGKYGVPARAEIQGGFFGTKEIALMLSLLRVIDNPQQDIPLTAVLLSPIFGFTPDELADIRCRCRRGSLYSAFIKYAQNEQAQKERAFLHTLADMRRRAAVMPCDRLINEIYSQTGMYDIFAAMKNGQVRVANLRLLLNYAHSYEQTGSLAGLNGFISFIDRLEQEKGDLASADAVAAHADTVKIMSIHHSKGLEFPVCILAGITKRFNLRDASESIILHSDYGVGLKIRSESQTAQYDTVMRTALSVSTQSEEVAEEMRILYVALTRAKEKLILCASYSDTEKKLSAYSSFAGFTPYYAEEATSYANWIIPCAMLHPECSELRYVAGAQNIVLDECDFPLKTVFGAAIAPSEQQEQNIIMPDKAEIDRTAAELKERFSYVYPYKKATETVSKVTASQLTKQSEDADNIILTRPAFTYKHGLTPTEKGNAVHHFMQYANYAAAHKNPGDEAERLLTNGFLTDEEAGTIDYGRIKAFFESELYAQIAASKNVMREVRLTSSLKQNGEFVLLQAMADLVFEQSDGTLCIVDYKTDRVKNIEALAEKYSVQINLYRTAAEKCLGKRVDKCILYSFNLDKWIEISAAT